MLEYDTCLKDTSRKRRRIDISEGIDINKTNAIFVTTGFKYEPYLYNGCYNLMQKAMSFNNVKRNAYRIHFWYMSKDDAISIMNNSNLIDKKYVF